MSEQKVSFMENHFMTVAMAILVSLGGWNLKSTSELQANHDAMYQEMTGKLNLQTAQLEFLKQNFQVRTLDRYTGTDASRDKSQVMNEINMLKLKYDSLRVRVDRGFTEITGIRQDE